MQLCDQRQKEIETLMQSYKEIEMAKVDMDAKIKEYHMYQVTSLLSRLFLPPGRLYQRFKQFRF